MTDVGPLEGDIRQSKGPRLAELAAVQHGVVGHDQLLALGIGRSAIQHRIRAGSLHVVFPGAYALGHERISRHGRWMAAVLSCGPDAVLSHRDAGALLGIRRSGRRYIDVTTPARGRKGHDGITIHRVRGLHPADVTVVDNIPVTSFARTLLDLAEVLTPRELKRAIEEAERLRLFDLRAVEELIARSPGRRGLRPLRAALREVKPVPFTRSELERDFLDMCEAAGFPRPAMNVWVGAYEVDAVWFDEGLVVELDSRGFHLTRAAFEEDRVRDAALQLAGFRVLRITHRRFYAERPAVEETIRALLAKGAAARAASSAG